MGKDSETSKESLTIRKNVSETDLLLGIISIAVKYNQSYEEILAYTKLLDPKFIHTGLPTTKHMLWRVLQKNDEAYQRHYFCRHCKSVIGKGNEITDTFPRPCRKSGPSTDINTLPYFLLIDLQTQIGEFLRIPNISTALRYRFTQKIYDDAMTDIYDGEKYKELCAPGKFLHNEYNFSYMFNTDGASYSNSSNSSVWPIYVTINKLPPHMRKRHMFLAGIWVDKKKPIANDFFSPFVEQANKKLYEEGVVWKPDGRSTVTSEFIPVIFCADTPARCQFLRMKQLNGTFGCTYCLIPGTFPMIKNKKQSKKQKSTQAKYPCDKKYQRRTHKSIKTDGINALKTGKNIRGVLGPSVLGFLMGFKLDTGCVPDPMHFLWLGVIRQHISMLLEEVGKIENVQKCHPWYIGSPENLKQINEISLSIRLPNRISRRPEDIKFYKQYKATAWRNLAYFFLICLEDILPAEDRDNLALLFEASYICNQDKIMYHDLDRVEKLIEKHLEYFQARHGISKMTYNMHLLTHMVEFVESWGPFWTHNATIFKSMYHRILQMITSANGVADQIAVRFLMNRFIQNCAYDKSVSLETRKAIAELLNVKIFDECINNDTVQNNIRFKNLGNETKQRATDVEIQILREAGYECSTYSTYNQVLINGVEYRTSEFRSTTAFSNCTVYCEGIGFGDIQKILSFGEGTQKISGIILQRLETIGDALNTTFIKDVAVTDNQIFVEVSKISGPAFKVEKKDKIRAIKIPNCWESD